MEYRDLIFAFGMFLTIGCVAVWAGEPDVRVGTAFICAVMCMCAASVVKALDRARKAGL